MSFVCVSQRVRAYAGIAALTAMLAVTGCGGGGGGSERPATVNPPPTAQPPQPAPTVPPATGQLESDAAAARFLTQATFGPTLVDIAYLRGLGSYDRWITEQFQAEPSYLAPYLHTLVPVPDDRVPTDNQRTEAWLQMAIGGRDALRPGVTHRDQLRQRVAFALSEIFVVSDKSVLRQDSYSTAHYYDVLVRGGLGNYRQLLEDVTLHPVMGIYLSMLGNQKPDPARNIRPDENYAREVMQLFSIGLVQLNQDGTRKPEGGQPVPTYSQDTIQGFAHVFTGWSFANCSDFRRCGAGSRSRTDPVREQPMAPYDAFHASAQSKQLLVYPGVALPGGVLAAGGDARSDLAAALDNIFHHPNVGPFIGRQLIQRLVTSNPSPAYVGRVAAAFANNGHGVRGDMQAVVRTILLDPEARQGSAQPANFGKAREPLLRLTHLWRAMDARSRSGRLTRTNGALEANTGQYPLGAPSVFNFFSPEYRPVGELTTLSLAAPELSLANDSLIPRGNNFIWLLLRNFHTGVTDADPDDILLDLDRDALLAADPAVLVDRYNLLFMSGQMSAPMRATLLDYLSRVNNANAGRDRVQRALYLILNSPEYLVQK